MLTLIETIEEKRAANEKLQARLKRAWPHTEERVVVWRPSSRRMTIYHDGKYWFGSSEANQGYAIPRFWQPFGEYRANGNLQISVELNVPTNSNSKLVAGFLARDVETGTAYLMHDGGVGGGRKGVGRTAFLAWSDSKLMPVMNAQGNIRPGIVVAPVDLRTTAADIARFVQQTIDFKEAVRRGETTTKDALAAQQRYGDYFDEFSGKKRRRRLEEIEYISRHGDIVRALRDWRDRSIKRHERVFKNPLVDLGVEAGDVIREIYEVKTSCDRQALYLAIGQVMVHDESPKSDCKKFLVLPDNGTIPDDIARAFDRAGISLIRYAVQDDQVRILSP